MTNSCENCKWRTRPEGTDSTIIIFTPICVVTGEPVQNLDNICAHHEVRQ
ncbi:unnamed protein product [marine sediment metagenome]|uniref:Uncharacterized protein n=1 Tax=marine sediment metagenome TaxID=412755 RepID=X0XDF4_9ZZZZ